jgi:hypothetical protein
VASADHPVDTLAEAVPDNTASAAALAIAIMTAVQRFIRLAPSLTTSPVTGAGRGTGIHKKCALNNVK